MKLSISIPSGRWRRLLLWCTGAFLLPFVSAGFGERSAPKAASVPRIVSRIGPDTETPWVQITPSGIVHGSSVNVLITYCDDSTLNSSSRTITRDGSAWALGYTTSTKRGCGAYATSSGSFTLGINASTTIAAAISDNRGNRGSASVTITYVPTYTVAVTADSAAVTRQSDASTSQTFTVRNSGSETGTYTLTPTCTGAVNSCSAPTSVQVAAGQSASVAVSYHTAIGPATGTVSLQAVAQQDNSFTGSGSSTVTVLALPSDVMVNGMQPAWTGLERSACVSIAIVRDVAAQCDAFRLLHPLPAVTTRGKARVPTLVYFSDWVYGTSASVNVSIPTSIATIPDSVQFNVYQRNADSTRTLIGTRSYGWAVDGFGRAPERLTVGWVDARTGILFYRLETRFKSGAGAWQTNAQLDGEILSTYRPYSAFGTGWWLEGVEQLALNQAGPASRPDSVVEWIGGDGSMRKYVYRQTVNAQDVYTADLTPDRPDTLIKNPGTPSLPWTRKAGNNVRVVFDNYGRHGLTINRVNDTTRMAWKSDGTARLDTLIVPGGLRYVFQYDANNYLTTVVAPGATSARQVQFARQVVNSAPTGGIRKITDPSQDSVVFSYDWGGGVIITARTDRRGVRTQLNWEDYGPGLASASTPDGNGNTITHQFRNPGVIGRLPTSKPISVDSLFLRYTNPRGYATNFWLNSLGAPTQVVNTLGQTTAITYGDSRFPGLATQVVRPGGLTSQATYNARGLVDNTTVLNPLGDGRNATTTYRWDPVWNMLTGLHSPSGVADSTAYDAITGNRLWQQDGRGSVSRVQYGYDAQNRLISVQPPGNAPDKLQRIGYDAVLGNVASVTTPLGFVSHFYQDAIGRDTLTDMPIDTLQTLRQKVRMTYNIADEVDSIISVGPAVPYTMHSFSSQYTWSAALHPDTLYAKHSYDAEHRLTNVTSLVGPADTLGDIYVSDSYTYDNLGRKTYHSTTHGPWERFTYDVNGNVLSSARPSGTFTMQYDALDRLTLRVMPARSYSQQRCEGFPYGPETGDSTGAGCFEVYPAFPNDSTRTGYLLMADTARFTYDANTGLMLTADNRYAKVHRSYYPNGAILRDSLSIQNGPQYTAGNGVVVGTAYQGSPYGLTRLYNIDGKDSVITSPSVVGGGSVTYAYRADNGALSSITDPSGNWFRYTYDGAGRLDSLLVGAAGASKSIWETHAYDADGRQTRRTRSISASNLFDESFWYDAEGRAARVTRWTAANGQPADTSYFVYSGLGAAQVRERIDQLGHWESEEFRNDGFGNVLQSRTGQSDNGGVQDPRYSTYLFRGQLSARNTSQPVREEERFTQAYDADGNVSLRFLDIKQLYGSHTTDDQVRNYYDAANRLRALQHYNTLPTAGTERGTFDEYEYDALGRRIVVVSHRNAQVPACAGIPLCITNLCNTTTCASSATRYMWDGQQILTEDRFGIDGSGQASDNGTVTYVNGPQLDRPVGVLDSRVSGGLRVPHASWRGMYESSSTASGAPADCSLTTGSCQLVAWNATGAIYQRPVPQDVNYSLTYTWVGGVLMDQQDASGLLYRRNRYYDPTSGRFSQEDPIGLAGGLNTYGFASGDAVNYSDPFGLCSKADHWANCPDDRPLDNQMSNRRLLKAGIAVASAATGTKFLSRVMGELLGSDPAPARVGVTSTVEDGVVTISAQGANGEITIMGNISREGDVITLDATHIEGAGAGSSSLSELRGVIKDFGANQGASRVIINGARRTTGLHQGRIPRSFTIDIPKPE